MVSISILFFSCKNLDQLFEIVRRDILIVIYGEAFYIACFIVNDVIFAVNEISLFSHHLRVLWHGNSGRSSGNSSSLFKKESLLWYNQLTKTIFSHRRDKMNFQDFPDELEFKANSKKFAMKWLFMFIQACPQIIKPEIGVEAFVDELNNACKKFAEYFIKQD